ncbi:N-acetylmuramate alpha-1-phosphate uridylyltransferase MurU [Thiofilum flexile]|uniref:N-acetylmuramate alpha-1-phosphate uridylyltransferase MurU n=1 Tax=Thiofilum flexile TaxID=125627 RepID=UPI000377E26E|nr:nucleotidyltransferase family protein [Thiofilum flexile]
MKAMILAAGLGTRMRPLTNYTPKPLLLVGHKPLIEWQIDKLVAAGIREIVINIAHLGWQIPEALGSGDRWNIQIRYSDEQREGALETAGGIIKALPLLGTQPFLVINGDIWCDLDYSTLSLNADDLAQLVLVPNPSHHPNGDFALSEGRVRAEGAPPLYTFSGIGLYSPKLFSNLPTGKRPLAPLLRAAMAQKRVGGQLYKGDWRDIGTPERLHQLDDELVASA